MKELKEYNLSNQLQGRIQGLVGKLVALDYILESYIFKNIEKEFRDYIIITTSRCNMREYKPELIPHREYIKKIVHKTPREFLYHYLVHKLSKIDDEENWFYNADFFEEYRSKIKRQMLSELKQLCKVYKKKERWMRI